MIMVDVWTMEGMAQVGFPIAVTMYLLYERTKFNERIALTLDRVAETLTRLEQRLMK